MMSYKTFHYPDGSRACASGQRRCAVTAMDLLLSGAEERKRQLIERAITSRRKVDRGANVPKHDLLELAVVELYLEDPEQLKRYIHTKKGDYTLETYTGKRYPSNIFRDLETRKSIF